MNLKASANAAEGSAGTYAATYAISALIYCDFDATIYENVGAPQASNARAYYADMRLTAGDPFCRHPLKHKVCLTTNLNLSRDSSYTATNVLLSSMQLKTVQRLDLAAKNSVQFIQLHRPRTTIVELELVQRE